jgi:hypothetical protein
MQNIEMFRIGILIGDNSLSKKLKGTIINAENFRLFLLCIYFGKTSPKSKIKKVTNTTSTTNLITGDKIFSKGNFLLLKIITTPMFKKLLANNSVANSFFVFEGFYLIVFLFWDYQKTILQHLLETMKREQPQRLIS